MKLMSLMTELERFLEECRDEEIHKETLDLYFTVRMFLDIHDRLDENYMIYSELEDTGRFKLCLFCVNPANCLKEFLDKGNSTVFFSQSIIIGSFSVHRRKIMRFMQNLLLIPRTEGFFLGWTSVRSIPDGAGRCTGGMQDT